MSDHGDGLSNTSVVDERAPWATAEKMTALLLAAAVLAVIGGISGAWDGWNRQVSTYADPNDPSAFTSQAPDALTRLANVGQGFGTVTGVLLLLGFITLFLLWRHVDDLEVAGEGDFPLSESEVARAGWWLRGMQAVFVLMVVAALGGAFGWWQQINGSSGPGIGAFDLWNAFVPELGTALAGVAGLIGAAALLRDQRDLVVTETAAPMDEGETSGA